MLNRKNLSPPRQKFVALYVANMEKDERGEEAADLAGYRPAYGAVLLKEPEIQDAIRQRLLLVTAPLEVNARDIVQRWLDIATADPLKVIHVRKLCCRHCWGLDHAYQWTELEFNGAVARAAADGKPLPSDAGGLDYEFNQPPNPECPQCRGEGVEDLFIEDMNKLDGPERRLISGVERTKNGLKITFHNQLDALDKLAAAMGFKAATKIELSGPGGGPIQTQNAHAHANLKELTPQEASKVYQSLVSAKPE